MKLKFSIVLLMAAVASSAQVKLGVNVGATQSGLYGNDVAKTNTYATDFLGGFSIEVALDSSFTIVGNINYERKSHTRKIYFEEINFDPIVPITYSEVDSRTTMHYITETVLARYYFGQSRKIFANAGIFGGTFLGDTYKIDGNKVENDADDYLKKVDFGVSAGFGAAFNIDAKNTLSLELRDNLGLLDLNNIDNSSEKIKTHNVNLILNWSFTL